MKIVVLDASALNPGDLSWECLNQFGEVTLYERTESEEDTIKRIADKNRHNNFLLIVVPPMIPFDYSRIWS